MDTTPKQLVRYMTHNETISGKRKRFDYKADVRVWQGKDAVSIVLANMKYEFDEHVPIEDHTAAVANFVNEAILRHPIYGFLYFEYGLGDQSIVGYCDRVHFEYGGNANRVKLFYPERELFLWSRLEQFLGCTVER